MAWTTNPPCTVVHGSQLTQLIPLPAIPSPAPILQQQQNAKRFESTSTPQIFWSKVVRVQQPLLTCQIESKSFTSLVNTRADVSIISQKEQPPEWRLAPSTAIVAGIRGQQIPQQSTKELKIIRPEDKTATLQPYVLLIPATLPEQNLMTEWGLIISTHF